MFINNWLLFLKAANIVLRSFILGMQHFHSGHPLCYGIPFVVVIVTIGSNLDHCKTLVGLFVVYLSVNYVSFTWTLQLVPNALLKSIMNVTLLVMDL